MRSGWVRAAALAGVLALAACGRGSAPASRTDLAGNLAEARAFMARNATAEGVRSLPSGVQYKVVASGPPGGERPDGNDLVRVDYEGALTDGTVFDSSFQRGVPAVFTLDTVVPGWSLVVQQMRPGDEWIVYIPPELGYGEQDKGDIPPNSALVFRLKLLDIARNSGDAPPAGTAMG
jgi:peptidylprolyl isomerase/FKBP-type peptidyl-prolyl cis-trans isomerase FklB